MTDSNPRGPCSTRPGSERTVEVTVAHARERFAVDPTCAQGLDGLGLDVEVVVAELPAAG